MNESERQREKVRKRENKKDTRRKTHIKLLIDPKLSIKRMALREAFSHTSLAPNVCVRICAAVF